MEAVELEKEIAIEPC